MYQIRNLTENDDINVLETLGAFTTIEYIRDLSVTPNSATCIFCKQNECTQTSSHL